MIQVIYIHIHIHIHIALNPIRSPIAEFVDLESRAGGEVASPVGVAAGGVGEEVV